MPPQTWRESADTTSIGSRAASATAAAVLPTPVGPAMTRSGGLSDISGSLPFGLGSHYQLHHRLAQPHHRLASAVERPRLALPCPLQLAADVVQRHAAHDGPAVGAEVRRARLAEVADEALHLLARQRRVGLDRAA